MRAWTTRTEPGVLDLAKVPVPEPGPGGVRVKSRPAQPAAPTSMSSMSAGIVAVLVYGLGDSISRFADRASLRWAGLMMIAAGLIGLPNHTMFAMTSRWLEGGFNDRMHIILSATFSLFVGRWLRADQRLRLLRLYRRARVDYDPALRETVRRGSRHVRGGVSDENIRLGT